MVSAVCNPWIRLDNSDMSKDDEEEESCDDEDEDNGNAADDFLLLVAIATRGEEEEVHDRVENAPATVIRIHRIMALETVLIFP
jgi:hypothetical protein